MGLVVYKSSIFRRESVKGVQELDFSSEDEALRPYNTSSYISKLMRPVSS